MNRRLKVPDERCGHQDIGDREIESPGDKGSGLSMVETLEQL
jgi:hypothetical protein